jgi:hypothetical protein
MIPIDWRTALSVWWSIAWRAAIYGCIGGFVFGAAGGVVAALSGNLEKAEIYGMIGGYIATIPASILATKHALSKHLVRLAGLAKSEG